jgi:hypothetical protein
MKTFNEFYQNQRDEAVIRSLSEGLASHGIDAPTVVKQIIEDLLAETEDQKDREILLAVEQKVLAEFDAGSFGARVGQAAGQAVQGARNFFGGLKGGYQAGQGQQQQQPQQQQPPAPRSDPRVIANAIKALNAQLAGVSDPRQRSRLQNWITGVSNQLMKSIQQAPAAAASGFGGSGSVSTPTGQYAPAGTV